MSISFSALKRNHDLTLPSVEGWGTNMNIVRDPKKSIHTRKIDKVGSNMDIIDQIDQSGDRMCQGINVYARGVNPMVNVSYTNASNNGGKSALSRSGMAAASLPYKVAEAGAFRPPIISPRELLPLSRQPRLTTQAITNPQAINYTKRALCPTPDKMKQIRKITLETNTIRPTAVYKTSKMVQDINPTNAIIENPINISGYSGVKTQAHRANLKHQDRSREINDKVYKVVTTNPYSDTKSKKVQVAMDTDKYLRDVRYKAVTSNPGRKGDGKNYVNKEMDLKKNLPTHNVTSNPGRKGDGKNYVNKEMDLKKNLPTHNVITNPGKLGYGDFYANNVRGAKITPKIKVEPGVQYLGNLGDTKMRQNQNVTFRQSKKCKNEKVNANDEISKRIKL